MELFIHIRKRLSNWFGRNSEGCPNLKDSITYESEIIQQTNDHKTSIVGYDENLLERAHSQWQFGDWDSLIKLDHEALEHHPDRSKLALLAAAGHIQEGDMQVAKQFIQLAQDWGCNKNLVSRILIAGVYNTIGRAAALRGDSVRAYSNFEAAVAIGSPSGERRLLTRALANEQLSQLGLVNENIIFNLDDIISDTLKKHFKTYHTN